MIHDNGTGKSFDWSTVDDVHVVCNKHPLYFLKSFLPDSLPPLHKQQQRRYFFVPVKYISWNIIALRVCMVSTCSRVWINRVRLSILLVISWTGKNYFFPVPVHAWEFGLARQVRPSRPASACSFSSFRLDLMLIHRIPPEFIPSTTIGPIPIRVYRVTQLRTDDVHCRESTSTGPVNLKVVVPVADAAFSGFAMNQFLCAPLFQHPLLLVWSGHE